MIDAHCHIDLYPKPTEVADRANRANVLTVLVTNLPSAFEQSYPHIKQFPNIRLALGLHPLLALQHQAERNSFQRLINKTSYIGEIGLDFSPAGFQTKDIQIDSFKFVLNTINKKPKFITVHSRRAESAVLDLLEEANYPFPAVFHWYSGSLSVLEKVVKKGHYFSINAAMLDSPNGQKIIDRIPPERALTESDGPFVKYKSRIIEPADVSIVERFLAEAWSVSAPQVRSKIRENFMKIISPIRLAELRTN